MCKTKTLSLRFGAMTALLFCTMLLRERILCLILILDEMADDDGGLSPTWEENAFRHNLDRRE